LHLKGEKIIEESGTPFTILRPNTFMQFFVSDPTSPKHLFPDVLNIPYKNFLNDELISSHAGI
jgi:hypothetical protein